MEMRDFDSQIDKLKAERAARVKELQEKFPYLPAGAIKDPLVQIIDESVRALEFEKEKYQESLGPKDKEQASESIAKAFTALMRPATAEHKKLENYSNLLRERFDSKELEDWYQQLCVLAKRIEELRQSKYFLLKELSPTSLELLEKAKGVSREILHLDYQLNNIVYAHEKRLYDSKGLSSSAHNVEVTVVEIKPFKNAMFGLQQKNWAGFLSEIDQLTRFLGKHELGEGIERATRLLKKPSVFLSTFQSKIDLNVDASPETIQTSSRETTLAYSRYLLSNTYVNISASWGEFKCYLLSIDGLRFLISQGTFGFRDLL